MFAGTFEVDTANTNMLLEKRGDIIRKKKIMVGPFFNKKPFLIVPTWHDRCVIVSMVFCPVIVLMQSLYLIQNLESDEPQLKVSKKEKSWPNWFNCCISIHYLWVHLIYSDKTTHFNRYETKSETSILFLPNSCALTYTKVSMAFKKTNWFG